MIRTKFLASIAMLGLAIATPAHATLPSPPPPEYGAYGPLLVCEGRFSIAVRPNEGLHVIGPIFRVINDDYLIAATPVVVSTSALGLFGGPFRHGSFVIGSLPNKLTMAFRYSGELPETAKPFTIFAREGFGEDDVRYAIEAPTGGSADDPMMSMLIVASPSFDGTDADKAILERFQSNAAGEPACTRPADIASGMLDPAAPGFTRSFNNPFFAGLYPSEPDQGPGFHCQGGIGFAFHADEQVRRPWKSQRRGQSDLLRGGVAVTLSGPVEPMQRTDPADANEHPAGQLHDSAVTFYPSRGVGPPYAAPGVREDGSWLFELGREKRSRLEIRFPAGDKAALGFSLIERLEFVSPDDPRCAAPPQ